MKRRDFLFLRTEASTSVAELSCERLYMHYQHAGVTSRRADTRAVSPAPDLGEEEPPAEFAERTSGQLFSDVDEELRGADVLRVRETEWLAVEGFGRDVEGLVAAFRSRGGRVEYLAGPTGAIH